MDSFYDQLKDAMSFAITQILTWEILHESHLEHGGVITFRRGSLGSETWWCAMVEVTISSEEQMLDVPPQEEWGDKVLASSQKDGIGLIVWTFETQDELILEMSRLFGMFQTNPK